MAKTQKLTLSIDKETLELFKIISEESGILISRWVTKKMENEILSYVESHKKDEKLCYKLIKLLLDNGYTIKDIENNLN